MRKLLSTSFVVLVLVVSAAGAAPAAHATIGASCSFSDQSNCSAALGESCNLQTGQCTSLIDTSAPTSAGAPSASTAQDSQSAIGTMCSLTNTPSCPGNEVCDTSQNPPMCVANLSNSGSGTAATQAAAGTPASAPLGTSPADQFGTVMSWIMSLFAWLVGVAALELDYSVYYTVVTMGNYVHNLSAVGVTWRILRDIGNIMLIFGFLAVGITTILNVDWYGGGKKMLPMMLVAAVFLNFSLFISEAIIDTGNLFATQFYQQINGGMPMTAATLSNIHVGTPGLNTGYLGNEGISNAIMGKLGLQTIYNVNTNPVKLNGANKWIVGFMGIILFLVAAFVMFSLAFVLVFRFVVLIFLIILAPVGFAGLAVPMLAKRAGQWWDKLFEQTITAPILLLMLYIALAIITDANFLTGASNGDWGGFVTRNGITGFAGLLLSFIIAMGLLIAVVMQSKNLSAFGADWASQAAGRITFGATAFVGRRTVGRASNSVARRIRSSSFGASETGRILAGTLDRGAKASFDIRGATIGGGLKGIGVEAGDAQKGGYRAREDELIKVRTDYAKSLRQSKGQKEAVKTAEEAYKENMEPLEAAEKAQLAASKPIIEASKQELKLERQKLDILRRSGASKDDIRDAQTAVTLKENAHKDIVTEEAEKLEPIRTKIAQEKKDLETATADNSVEALQRQYGKALQEKTVLGIIPRLPYDWTTATGSARSESSNKILADAKKDKNQKNLDKLEEILSKSEKKVDSGSGPAKP